jgi:hypothetical protein
MVVPVVRMAQDHPSSDLWVCGFLGNCGGLQRTQVF